MHNSEWRIMLSRSFNPRQWFVDEDDRESLEHETSDEDMTMWVYRQQGDNFTVGFYSPDGQWNYDSDWSTRESAAKRVNFLNGGSK